MSNATLGLDVSVADARVFDSSVGRVIWALKVVIGAVDVSSRLVGEVTIDAAEDSARVASVQFLVTSPAELAMLESAQITIDVVASGNGFSATRRRFTGVVHSVDEFSVFDRVVSISCRDGYQERIKSARSAAAVLQLLGGLGQVSDKIVTWNVSSPDPVAYFGAALATVPGFTFVDGAGQWRVRRWNITTADRVYTAADMFHPGPRIKSPSRNDVPSTIVASLTHRFYRLHNAEVDLRWDAWPRQYLLTRALPNLAVSTVMTALSSAGDWMVKGTPAITTIPRGFYPVTPLGGGAPVPVMDGGPEVAKAVSVTMYRRWYQTIDRTFTVRIPMPGSASPDNAVSRSVTSDFDAAGWEQGRQNAVTLGIFEDNPPFGFEEPPEVSGYQALDGPWPPRNSAVDHFGDVSSAEVDFAVGQVVAEAVRLAAQGRRNRNVSFDRPVDLRLDLGDVCGVDVFGVSGTGQMQRFAEKYNHDTGECVGDYQFAVPDGNSTVTTWSAGSTVPPLTVAHALLASPLLNFIGADTGTNTQPPNPDSVAGYLCNTVSPTTFYDDQAPVYVTQFRIVLPEIPADVRDPAVESVDVSATVSIAGSGLEVTF